MTQPIRGTWFEFQHHSKVEGTPWNPACARFTTADWRAKVEEMAAVGMEYLVLMAVALNYRTFYPTSLLPSWELPCPDPLQALLAAADGCGVKVFVGNGFWGQWDSPRILADAEARRRRLLAVDELAARYGDHASFCGWYWPNEAAIQGGFAPEFLEYARECSRHARAALPRARILIAPYGTNRVRADDGFARQLEALEVDIVAYQDEVGVRKSTADQTPAYFEALRRVHDRVPQVALWADVEVFEFAGEVYRSALLPADWSRVVRQLEAVSPFVDTVLIYQYLGLMNAPGSRAFAGPETSTRLYADYAAWRQRAE
ncbi:MAG: DUF4434 domain-containing protein [Candidatus Latescibacterota bacterium]